MSVARRCSAQCVTSRPASSMRPTSTKNVPATALSSVDLPEPLVPMTITNEPGSMCRFTSCRARTSFGVPGLKVLVMSRALSIARSCAPRAQSDHQVRKDEGDKDERRRNQLQVVRIQTRTQRDGHEQTEQHRAHDRTDDHRTELTRTDQRLA